MDNLVITIMAGGMGKRMKSDLPKVLNKFGDKPMIVCILNQCFKLNTKKIILITGKFDKLIRDTIKQYISAKNFEKIKFVIQENPLGTGHAVKFALPELEDNEEVLILNGDMPLINYNLIEKFYNSSKDNCLLVARFENSHGYGRIFYENGKFKKIIEQKDCTDIEKKINIINSGLYKIKSSDLKKYIPQINNNNNQNEYYLTDIIELMVNDNINIDTYQIETKDNKLITGVNTKEELEELSKFNTAIDYSYFDLKEDGFKRDHLYCD
tara:strand:- start:3546 stop:4349 length:804 start_codon:yes stop_codon:yes gene_type:complete